MGTDNIFPGNWKEIVGDKRVIFYNTSVGGMLSGREKRIEKMKWVFGIFQKHPEIVLWWRPHPLELTTIQSMVPDLEQQYAAMRTQFQKEQVGILDESADLHRAIAISDAYYGDWSSVAHLYKETKKPVLFENDSVLDLYKEVSMFETKECFSSQNAFCEFEKRDFYSLHSFIKDVSRRCCITEQHMRQEESVGKRIYIATVDKTIKTSL